MTIFLAILYVWYTIGFVGSMTSFVIKMIDDDIFLKCNLKSILLIFALSLILSLCLGFFGPIIVSVLLTTKPAIKFDESKRKF